MKSSAESSSCLIWFCIFFLSPGPLWISASLLNGPPWLNKNYLLTYSSVRCAMGFKNTDATFSSSKTFSRVLCQQNTSVIHCIVIGQSGYYGNLVPRVSHLTVPWGERGETLSPRWETLGTRLGTSVYPRPIAPDLPAKRTEKIRLLEFSPDSPDLQSYFSVHKCKL